MKGKINEIVKVFFGAFSALFMIVTGFGLISFSWAWLTVTFDIAFEQFHARCLSYFIWGGAAIYTIILVLYRHIKKDKSIKCPKCKQVMIQGIANVQTIINGKEIEKSERVSHTCSNEKCGMMIIGQDTPQ